MKRIFTLSLLGILSSVPNWAAQKTMAGEISDSMCGASHAAMGDMGMNPKECTAGCIKAGSKYVFVSKGKVYGIQNQDLAALAANAGGKVKVSGEVSKDGKNITLAKVAAVK